MKKHHIKWITVIGVILMLFALAIYLTTLDEADPREVPQVLKSE